MSLVRYQKISEYLEKGSSYQNIVLSDWKDWKERYRIIRNVPPTKRQKKKYQINIYTLRISYFYIR